MNKIIGKYTFSEAVEKVIEERKRLAWMNPSDKLPDDFKLPDPAECLIEEVENEKKLFDKFNKLKTEHEEQGETLCKTRKKLAKKDKKCHKLSKENEKLTKENEALHDKNDELTNEVELLKQKDAMRENQFESLNEYIKFLESRLNNQEDDNNKLYPEYHTHDTFKVHNKLAEVVSVLVDKDDVVYGYEIKFEDSDDTFIVYPEEIED